MKTDGGRVGLANPTAELIKVTFGLAIKEIAGAMLKEKFAICGREPRMCIINPPSAAEVHYNRGVISVYFAQLIFISRGDS